MKHTTIPYLLNPEKLVSFALIGCGGTGTQVLTCLARLNEALVGIGHPGISVTAYDGDDVDHTNVGRQLFSPQDIGQNKAVISISRINRFFGYEWTAVPYHATRKEHFKSNIIISCVDSAQARVMINDLLIRDKTVRDEPDRISYYWLDFGNDFKTGQVVLGTVIDKELPNVIDRFPVLKKRKVKKSEPSCSIAQSLGKQDLFINSTIAQLGMNLIWKLFREAGVDYGGLYLNLETLNVNPIKL